MAGAHGKRAAAWTMDQWTNYALVLCCMISDEAPVVNAAAEEPLQQPTPLTAVVAVATTEPGSAVSSSGRSRRRGVKGVKYVQDDDLSEGEATVVQEKKRRARQLDYQLRTVRLEISHSPASESVTMCFLIGRWLSALGSDCWTSYQQAKWLGRVPVQVRWTIVSASVVADFSRT